MHLPLGSPELQRALHDDRGELRPVAIQGDLVELTHGPSVGRPSELIVWLTAGRTVSLTATASPAIATLLVVSGISWGTALLALVGVLLLQLGVNLDNDLEDHRRLIDLPGTFGGSGVLQRGWLSPRAFRKATLVLYTLGLAAGIPAFLRAPGPMAIVGVLAVLGGIGYSGRPFGLKYRALGDVAVLLLCGPALTLGMGVAATGVLVPALVPLGLAFGLLAIGILHTNNWQDIDIDRARGARTIAGLLGQRASRAYLVLLYLGAAIAWGVTAILLALPIWAALIPLLAALPTLALLRRVLGATDPHTPTLALLRIEAAQLHLVWGVTFIVALVAARVAGLFR